MTWDRALVDLVGLGFIAFIVWFFWFVKTKGVRAGYTSGGYQEQMVLVKGGYTPDVIVVERGKPVRLNFVRGVVEESTKATIPLAVGVQRSAFSPQPKVECRPLIAERRPAGEGVGTGHAVCEGGQQNHSQRRRRQ